MAPCTRKRPPRGSYVEEPESPTNTFDKLFNTDKNTKLTSTDEDSDYANGNRPKKSRIAKAKPCKIYPAQERHPATPEMSEEEDDDSEDTTLVDSEQTNAQTWLAPTSINLQLPVSLANTNININLHDLLKLKHSDQSSFKIGTDGNISVITNDVEHKDLFCRLPIEIRTRIWRLLFVTQEPIHFAQRRGFKRSAQVLRTSRIFHDEGTRILYGENCFHFERSSATRGRYWELQWDEIGFKDIHKFLRNIGENKKKMKYISFKCVDAAPNETPLLSNAERRFVNDVVLRQCFHMLANNTVLERFSIGTHGRAIVTENDCDFLRALTEIRCHELTFTDWFGPCKMGEDLMDKIRKLVEIKKKDSCTKRAVQVKMPFEYRDVFHMMAVW